MQATSEDDSYRRQRDDDRNGPPSSYHARGEMQIATRSNSGRRSSERPGESRERSRSDESRSRVSEHDDRRRYSTSATQRRRSTTEDDEDQWENSSQGPKAFIKDRLGSIFGKTKQSSGSERPERSSSYRSVPLSPRLTGSESGSEARRRRFSLLDDRLHRGLGRLDALREEEPDGSIADIEPGEVRQLMAPSPSFQGWVNSVPLSEHAVATFNAAPQVGRTRAQSDVPHSSRRTISQQRVPQSIAPGESAFSIVEPAHEAPSYGMLDRQKGLYGSTVKTLVEERHESKEKEEIAAAIEESIKDLAITAYEGSKVVKKIDSRSEAQGWDEDEISVAVEESIRDTGTSQRSNHGSSRDNNKYLTSQSLGQDLVSRRREETDEADRRRRDAEDANRMKREAENAARMKREADNAVRRVREATDAARRQKDAEDADRRRRDAEEATRRKRESDEADRRHEARLREVKHAAQLEKHEIDERKREAEHATRMRELELADKARELASAARARDAESARKVREERTASQRHIADETNRLANDRFQFEGERQKLEKKRAGDTHQTREHPPGQRSSNADPPPYSPYDGMASVERSTNPRQPQSTANHTPQAIYTPSPATPHPVTVHSQVTVSQATPPASYQPNSQSRSPHSTSQTTAPSTSPGEIYRPPRRIGNIMPDSITRIQQHYRFRRSLIDRNVHESRRTAEQGRTALACLNRNEVADIDSEPRRTQELNVSGLEAFEADIELLDRLGGDQMAPPVPWAIPSLEAQSHGNYNQAHLREHIERLLAQQNENSTAASGYVNAAGLGFAEYNGLGMNNTFGGYIPHGGGGAQFFEWYEEYRYQ